MNAQVKISYDALAFNARRLQNCVGNYYAVLKCDAYGHGARECAKVLYESGHRHYAVFSLDEALQIKRLADGADILILGRTPAENAYLLAQNRFIQTVFCADYALELSPHSKGVRTHIKLDCGMNRSGFKSEPEQIKNAFLSYNGTVEGVYTHFHSADEKDLTVTEKELDFFKRKSAELENLFGKKLIKHTAASAAALRCPKARLDICRVGLALYGIPPSNCEGICSLKPVMSLDAPVIDVRYLKKGENIGYGLDNTVSRDTVIATVAVGYASGVSRALLRRFKPVLHGKRVGFSGRICMDRCMLDITDLLESGISIKPYDTVSFFGRESSVSELAECEGTIPYEILTRVGRMCRN